MRSSRRPPRTLHRLARLDPLTRDTTQPAIRRALARAAGAFPGLSHIQRRAARARPADQAAFARAMDGGKADAPLSPAPRARPDRPLAGRRGRRHTRRRRCASPRHRPLPAAHRAGRRQGGRGHRLLSLRPPAVAQRGGFDAGQSRCRTGRVPRRQHGRARRFPDALLATATHDHKRGEDVRARLAVFSEMPDEWQATVQRWLEAQRGTPPPPAGPSHGDEAMLYQMIVRRLAADPAPRPTPWAATDLRGAPGRLAAEGNPRGQAARRLDRPGRSLRIRRP